MKAHNIILILFCLCFCKCSSFKNRKENDWVIADFLSNKETDVIINGSPKLVNSPFGKAVLFNGVNDAIFLNKQPLKNAAFFTVEMVFKPSEINAPFEQRIVHFGEVFKNRMLLEIRAVENNWYFDGFVASNSNKKTLLNEKLIHSLGTWQHIALVVTPNSLTTYVNGIKELEAPFVYAAINTGKTSLGVRLNKRSWFKGAIYKVKVTKKALLSKDFISIKNLIK